MTADQVQAIVHLKPFKPFRLVLADGENILVSRPRKSHVSGSVVSLVGQVSKSKDSSSFEKFRIIKVDDVVSAEHVDAPIREK